MKEIFERYSVRRFEDKEVSKKDIDELLRAGMAAPSAVNQQPWEFYAITNKEIRKELSEVTPYTKPIENAPLCIALVNRKETMAKDFQQIDMAICAENIMLEAVSLGLGSVIMGVAPLQERMEAVAKILDLPETLEAFALIAIGYPLSGFGKPQNRYDESRIHIIE